MTSPISYFHSRDIDQQLLISSKVYSQSKLTCLAEH